MAFGWGERELAKEVAFIFMLFVAILSKAHFMMSRGLLLTLLLKLLVFVCKAENLVAFLFIHTIPLTFMASKSHNFFFVFFVLPSLQVEKLEHCPILLMLD